VIESTAGDGVNWETQRVSASFEAADDLLWQAVAGRLPTLGAVTLGRSGRIGPLVELAMAMAALPDAYRAVTVGPPVFHQLTSALGEGMISGAGARDRAGVFPLSRFDPDGDGPEGLVWDQWAKHAENAAISAGLAKGLAAGLMGAVGELLENVVEHSGRPESGIVAYAASDGAFEVVVADAGRGVLASLRENPEFAGLSDSGTALRVAASDGASRHAQSSGHGYGIGQLFRALAHDAAELRFRSGDHALRLWGDAPSLTGHVELAQKAWLDGLAVSVRCAPDTPHRRS
jgi:anti-sigma regulatory factor (Ser/Thr protein kinase)